MKICSVCKEPKELYLFYVSIRAKDGRQHRCVECSKVLTQKATKQWRLNNPDRVKASSKRTKIKLKYGLSAENLVELFDEQNGHCAICGILLDFNAPSKHNKPHLDHDHKTGIARGILCLTCNTGIGMFNDDAYLLEAARNYLLVGHRERLSEEASEKEDAIVRSYGNENHERLVEIASPAISE